MKEDIKMKIALTIVLAILLVAPAQAQREAVVRGIGTETCKKLIASEHTITSVNTDDYFAQQALQWILGSITGYFRQANDDPSRTLGDVVLLQTVVDICKRNPEKTIDQATAAAIGSLPETEAKKPGEIR